MDGQIIEILFKPGTIASASNIARMLPAEDLSYTLIEYKHAENYYIGVMLNIDGSSVHAPENMARRLLKYFGYLE